MTLTGICSVAIAQVGFPSMTGRSLSLLSLWFQPWHWADPAWFSHFGLDAASLPSLTQAKRQHLLTGWCQHFGLSCDPALLNRLTDIRLASAWQRVPPSLSLYCTAPAVLQQAASLVGAILLAAIAPAMRLNSTQNQSVQRQALHYQPLAPRALRWTTAGLTASEQPSAMVHIGLASLETLSRATSPPPIGDRMAMMRPPRHQFVCFHPPEQTDTVNRLRRLWHTALRWQAQQTPAATVTSP